MKGKLFLIFALLSLSGYAQTVKTVSNTTIKEIKVYMSGAQVIRDVKANIEAGTTLLALEGLSEFINSGSITVTGTGEATLLSVSTEINYLNDKKKSSRLQQWQDSLDGLNHSLDKLNDLSSVFMGEVDMLNANKSVGGANVGVDKDNLKEVADFYRERMIELKVKLLDNKAEQKRLNEHIQKVSREIASLSAEENKPTNTILIAIDSKQATAISLEVSYTVTNAGWTPVYDIRAVDINSTIQLGYKANVFQSTGEDWKDVKLKLSTGNPSISGAKPTLYPWYLNFYPLITHKSIRELDSNVPMAAKAQPVKVDDRKSLQTTEEYVAVSQNQLTTDFNIAIPYSIPSDGKKYMVAIRSFSLPATYIYSAVPKLDKDAFLLARITGWDDLNLLSGQANVYFEGSFVGTSIIDTRSTKDTLDISLGRDKKIIVTREKKKDLSSSKLIGSNTVKEINYLVTVRNGKKDPVKIIIEDQLPVSKNSDIEVKAIDYDGADYSQETGKVTWNVDIAPGSSLSKKLNFSVKYLKNKNVEGL